MLDVEPNEPGEGFEFENKIVGGSIPREYISSIEPGVARRHGGAACSPASRWSTSRSTLVDGNYHDVDSSEMAFKIAGSIAFKEAEQRAKPVLLEPIMDVEVVTPEEYMGDVIGDLNSPPRPDRGHGAARQRADHPSPGPALRDVRLRYRRCARMTQGRATYSMQFPRYEEVPSTSHGIVEGRGVRPESQQARHTHTPSRA